MKHIVVLGGGFAGFWSAAGAARKLDELGASPDVRITLVDKNDLHSIRVRNYEADLDSYIIPFSQLLAPIGVEHLQGTVQDIDTRHNTVSVATTSGEQTLHYDRLVYALGSQVLRPSVTGLQKHAFDIDTYHGAKQLTEHLESLPGSSHGPEKYTAVVIGAGLTGIELACELPSRLQAIRNRAGGTEPVRVILADANTHIGSDMGSQAQTVINEALDALQVETLTDARITSVDANGLTLADGERIAASTVVWCAGMHANPLGTLLPVTKDRLGRIPVDEFMRVEGLAQVFGAGDAAWSMMDEQHASVMSCQHGRPMGRYAGHNVVADLLGEPMLPLRIDWYVTVLDLGPWGAVYTEGWDRRVVSTKSDAKQTKRIINGSRIYPPKSGIREEILAAAAPGVQTRPKVQTECQMDEADQ